MKKISKKKSRKKSLKRINGRKKRLKSWSHGCLGFYITVFFELFLMVFSGFSGASFPTFFRSLYFYGVTFKDFGDKTKILAKGWVFGFWYQGLPFGFRGFSF